MGRKPSLGSQVSVVVPAESVVGLVPPKTESANWRRGCLGFLRQSDGRPQFLDVAEAPFQHIRVPRVSKRIVATDQIVGKQGREGLFQQQNPIIASGLHHGVDLL
jgi:hypothetical protein